MSLMLLVEKKMPPAIRAWPASCIQCQATHRAETHSRFRVGLCVLLLHLVFPGLQAGAGGRGRRPGAVSFTGIAAKSAQSAQFQPAEAGC